MSEKKVVANGDLIDGPHPPALLSPGTFARHAAAVDRIESRIRTRAPRPGNGRSPGLAPGAWGLLASGGTIAGAAGKTLGTGRVKLCDDAGTVYPADESVGVLNAGAAITASGDRLLPLEWVLGDWTVCGGAAGCTTTICVLGCSAAVRDAVVTIKSGSTVIDSGVTGLDGCVTLAIPAAGSYTVVVSASCFQTHTSTETLACGGSITIGLTLAPGCVCPGGCCPGGAIPDTLFATDGLGTTTLTYVPSGLVTWDGFGLAGYAGTGTFSMSGASVYTVVGLGSQCIAGTGDIQVYYQLFCRSSVWIFERYWGEGHTTLDPVGWYYGTGAPGTAGDRCVGGFGPGFGGPQAIGTASASSCVPLVVSGSTTASQNDLGDPGGGSFAISQ